MQPENQHKEIRKKSKPKGQKYPQKPINHSQNTFFFKTVTQLFRPPENGP